MREILRIPQDLCPYSAKTDTTSPAQYPPFPKLSPAYFLVNEGLGYSLSKRQVLSIQPNSDDIKQSDREGRVCDVCAHVYWELRLLELEATVGCQCKMVGR